MADDDDGGISNALFAAAARGSLEAQRAIRDSALAYFADGAVSASEGVTLAEAFARLAAGHDDADDIARLAGILFMRASLVDMPQDRRDYAWAEGLAYANEAADAGHDLAASALASIPDAKLSPEIFAMAQSLCGRVNATRA